MLNNYIHVFSQLVSAEVLALRRHYSDLVGSIQDPEDISGLLYSQSMISRSVRDEVQERGHLIAQRKNEVLINAVEACVKASPQTFYVFTDVLRRVPYMTRCVGALTASVGELCVTSEDARSYIQWCVFCMFF